MDVSVVIVNYESGARLARLLDTLAGGVKEIIVVDNASGDGSAEAAASRAVTLLRNDRNTGFAAAANLGARGATASWLLFLNPDVHLALEDINALVSDVPARAAVVAPLQTDAAGRPRAESGGYAPSLPRYMLWALVPGRFHRRLGPWLAPPWPSSDLEVDWVSGAMMAIRRSVFETLGGFDERFFLYQEDVDFCARVCASGNDVLCRGAVRVFHEVANGDPRRRANETPLFVRSLGMQFAGWQKRALGGILWTGFSLRSLAGSRAARHALPACRQLLNG